jgi:hypothetical protein
MTEDLPSQNARLRRAVNQAAGKDAAVTAAMFKIALNQPGDASLEDVQANLQERAWMIIKQRPDLKDSFKDLLPRL